MLILILVDVQYSQNAVFSFEKGSNRQNHSSSLPGKKIPSAKFLNTYFEEHLRWLLLPYQ